MRSIVFKILIIFSIGLLIVTCASRGRPTGGDIDEDPPVIVKSEPENYTTNFKGDEIRIYFDEFVKLKNIQKQLIVSPPMDNAPIIGPLSASRYISIKIIDTLKPNTTYAFNFGQSIVDNNEENPFSYYRYVFSTGPSIDSLSVKGIVVDAEKREPDSFISVMLYEADSTYTDSIVYKQKPKYITNTLDSLTTFSIDNIKEGRYKLIALKDENGNFTYEPKSDKIGFIDGFIDVPKDTSYVIKLFKQTPDFKVGRLYQAGETRIGVPFEGNSEETSIRILETLPEDYRSIITKDTETDTLYYWYKPKLELDSTFFEVRKLSHTDTLKFKFKSADKDSLIITNLTSGNLVFNKNFAIESSTPLEAISKEKIRIVDKDSIEVLFEANYDSIFKRYEFPIKLEESQTYRATFLPGAFTDFYGAQNDTLNFGFRTRQKSDFGNIRVNLRNAKFPLIVQLVDERDKVLYEQYTESTPVIDFSDIDPKNYYIRVIFDDNKNGKFDSGNFLKGSFPERVSYYNRLIEVRANFDYVEEFTLLD